MSAIKLPRYVRAAMEAGCDLIEYPEGWRYVFHGFASPEAYKTDSACGKAALDFMEAAKAEKRANALRAVRERA